MVGPIRQARDRLGGGKLRLVQITLDLVNDDLRLRPSGDGKGFAFLKQMLRGQAPARPSAEGQGRAEQLRKLLIWTAVGQAQILRARQGNDELGDAKI